MPVPEADKLLERAKAGDEKLNTKDRRHVIAYLMATAPETSNVDMATWFKVSERQIRNDKRYIKEERAALIREEDIGLVIADIAMSFDNVVRELQRGAKKTTVGSMTHLKYYKEIFDTQLKKVKALQDLGYYPKNLGNMTVDKYEYKAFVNKDGSVQTNKVDLRFDEDGNIIDVEFEDVTPKQITSGSEVVLQQEEVGTPDALV
jgi:hypothetical protein